MLRYLLRFFAAVGFLVIAGISAAVWFTLSHEEKPPERIVLSFDLTGDLTEAPSGGLEEAFDRKTSLSDILDALERAERDPHVKGMVARFDGDSFGYAKAHDLRAAVERFRASGRFALAYADALGEGRSASVALSVASAFDEIWLQPMGMVSAVWPSFGVPFARNALENIGVTPQMEKREAYKSFADTFTETGLTPEHKEMLVALASGLGDELLSTIARGRRLPPDAVRALMDQAPLSDAQALQGRLIDKLGYQDEIIKEAERRAGPDAELLHPLDYLALAGGPHDDGALVAVIHAVGEITDGRGEKGNLDGLDAHAVRLVKAFDEAAEDPDVRAILFRIDSPGGSATASETIRRAMVQAKKAGKPVIVSMGDVAASGGYWIAMDADRIIAAPATLTGSIGVVVGKFPLLGLSAKLGVTWEQVKGGPSGGFWSLIQPWTADEQARIAARTDEIYAAFLRRVGEGRRMPADAVRAAAQGRVWTGAQARDRGLVDELGGRREALAAVRAAAKLPADAALELRPYPTPPSPLEQLFAMLGHDGGFAGLLRTATRLAALAPMIEQWAQIGKAAAGPAVSPAPGLTMPLPGGPAGGHAGGY
jgi:protease IV